MGKRAWNSGFAGGMGKRAWNSGFAGGLGKRAWNSGFAGGRFVFNRLFTDFTRKYKQLGRCQVNLNFHRLVLQGK